MHDIKPYHQDPEQCGPFALAALLEYAGAKSDVEDLKKRLYSPGAGGVLTLDLYLEARRTGLETRQLSGNEEILQSEILNYNPVIALFRYPGLNGTVGHFVLVTGYSVEPDGFFLLWGDGKISWVDRSRFDSLWSDSGRWMLTVRGKVEQ